jgi:hypothetical protein
MPETKKRKKRQPNNVIAFPGTDLALLRDVIGSHNLANVAAMPGGWAIYRWDGSLFGYLIKAADSE